MSEEEGEIDFDSDGTDDSFLSDNEFEMEDTFFEERSFKEEKPNIEEPVPAKIKEKRDTKKFEIFHENLIHKSIVKDLKKLQNYLFIDYASTLEILRSCNWNFEKVIDEYFTKGKEYVFQKVGLDCMIIQGTKDEGVIECPCCFEEVQKSKSIEVSKCKHKFCKNCFVYYLQTKLKDDKIGSNVGIKCPSFKCKILLPLKITSRFFKEGKEEIGQKIINNYVKTNKKLTYCPGANCKFVCKKITNDPDGSIFVNCECGILYCFKCKEKSYHFPATCLQMKDWMEKVKEETASVMWIELNAKKCPSCGTVISKNGGCNHMRCVSCQTQFCWFCLTPTGSLIHNCVFRKNVELTDQEKVKKLDKTNYFSAAMKWNMLQTSKKQEKGSYFDSKFLLGMVRVLVDARTVMCNCIVFHFYSFSEALFDLEKVKHDEEMNVNRKNRKRFNKRKKKKNQKGFKYEPNKSKSTVFGRIEKLEENIKKIRLFNDRFLFDVEQLEEKTEKLSDYLTNYEESDLLSSSKKREMNELKGVVKKLIENIFDTCSKKELNFPNFNV